MPLSSRLALSRVDNDEDTCVVYVGGVVLVVERRSLAGGLSLSCARPAANGRPLTWVSRPLQVNQLGQLSLSSFRGR